jgi:hypothetical protein
MHRRIPILSALTVCICCSWGCDEPARDRPHDANTAREDSRLPSDMRVGDAGILPDTEMPQPPDSGTPTAAIIFSAASRTFVEPFQITISASTPQRRLVYTLDGSTPDESSVLYSGPITVDSTTWIRVREMGGGATDEIVDRWFIAVAPRLANFDSNLPLVVIDSWNRDVDAESETERPYRPIHIMTLSGSNGGRTSLVGGLLDHAGHAAMHVRGSSTSRYPKKQYRLELRDARGEDQDDTLLGLPDGADWILQAPYGDKSLIRNVLMYQWSNAIGRYAARTRLVELFVAPHGGRVGASEDDYRGVYVVTERLKRHKSRINVDKLSTGDNAEPEVTGGYILKRDWVEGGPNEHLETETYNDVLTWVYPKPSALTDAQRQWMADFLNRFERVLSGPGYNDPETGYKAFIDVDSFIDHHLLVEMARNVDGFVLSTHMHKTRDGKLNMGPIWDYNGALGNADYFQAWRPEGWHHQFDEGPGGERFPADNPNGYHWYCRLFVDPVFRDRYAARWLELRDTLLPTVRLLDDIKEITSRLNEAAGRNFERWPILGEGIFPDDAHRSMTEATYASETDYLQTWLSARVNWMDSAVGRLNAPECSP